jgi:hypothetical protein
MGRERRRLGGFQIIHKEKKEKPSGRVGSIYAASFQQRVRHIVK